MAALGLPTSMLGVDVVRGGRLVAADADEEALLALAGPDAHVVVTPVGGQGFVLGRGNQQLSRAGLRARSAPTARIVATEAKLAALGGRPLLRRHRRRRARRRARGLPPGRHGLPPRDRLPDRGVRLARPRHQ